MTTRGKHPIVVCVQLVKSSWVECGLDTTEEARILVPRSRFLLGTYRPHDLSGVLDRCHLRKTNDNDAFGDRPRWFRMERSLTGQIQMARYPLGCLGLSLAGDNQRTVLAL